jgi:hypothetical protein
MLFHEVVHGHEYGALGLKHFIHEYLAGVTASRDYRDLPLERVAYAAQDRYMLNPQVVFSVDEMVGNMA